MRMIAILLLLALSACGEYRPMGEGTRALLMNPVPAPYWPQPVYRAW